MRNLRRLRHWISSALPLRLHLQAFRFGQFALALVKRQQLLRFRDQRRGHMENVQTPVAFRHRPQPGDAPCFFKRVRPVRPDDGQRARKPSPLASRLTLYAPAQG